MYSVCLHALQKWNSILPKLTEKNDPKMRQITIRNFCNHRASEAQKNEELLTELQIVPSKFYLFKYYCCFQVMIFQTLRKSSKRS